jgi:hypothetical protein
MRRGVGKVVFGSFGFSLFYTTYPRLLFLTKLYTFCDVDYSWMDWDASRELPLNDTWHPYFT